MKERRVSAPAWPKVAQRSLARGPNTQCLFRIIPRTKQEHTNCRTGEQHVGCSVLLLLHCSAVESIMIDYLSLKHKL